MFCLQDKRSDERPALGVHRGPVSRRALLPRAPVSELFWAALIQLSRAVVVILAADRQTFTPSKKKKKPTETRYCLNDLGVMSFIPCLSGQKKQSVVCDSVKLIYVSVYQFVCLPVCLSVSPSFSLSVRLCTACFTMSIAMNGLVLFLLSHSLSLNSLSPPSSLCVCVCVCTCEKLTHGAMNCFVLTCAARTRVRRSRLTCRCRCRTSSSSCCITGGARSSCTRHSVSAPPRVSATTGSPAATTRARCSAVSTTSVT